MFWPQDIFEMLFSSKCWTKKLLFRCSNLLHVRPSVRISLGSNKLKASHKYTYCSGSSSSCYINYSGCVFCGRLKNEGYTISWIGWLLKLLPLCKLSLVYAGIILLYIFTTFCLCVKPKSHPSQFNCAVQIIRFITVSFSAEYFRMIYAFFSQI